MLSKYSGMSHMRTQMYSASSEGLHLALAAWVSIGLNYTIGKAQSAI